MIIVRILNFLGYVFGALYAPKHLERLYEKGESTELHITRTWYQCWYVKGLSGVQKNKVYVKIDAWLKIQACCSPFL